MRESCCPGRLTSRIFMKRPMFFWAWISDWVGNVFPRVIQHRRIPGVFESLCEKLDGPGEDVIFFAVQLVEQGFRGLHLRESKILIVQVVGKVVFDFFSRSSDHQVLQNGGANPVRRFPWRFACIRRGLSACPVALSFFPRPPKNTSRLGTFGIVLFFAF